MRLYFFSRLGGALKRGVPSAAGAPTQDPIDHPAIAAMSLRELADLPLRPDPIPTRAHRYGDRAQASKARC
jgi:hypothetical protein